MIQRLWLVLSVVWTAFVGLLAAEKSVSEETLAILGWVGVAPWIAGPVVWWLGRWVIHGRKST
jgi:hypothetical protein